MALLNPSIPSATKYLLPPPRQANHPLPRISSLLVTDIVFIDFTEL